MNIDLSTNYGVELSHSPWIQFTLFGVIGLALIILGHYIHKKTESGIEILPFVFGSFNVIICAVGLFLVPLTPYSYSSGYQSEKIISAASETYGVDFTKDDMKTMLNIPSKKDNLVLNKLHAGNNVVESKELSSLNKDTQTIITYKLQFIGNDYVRLLKKSENMNDNNDGFVEATKIG